MNVGLCPVCNTTIAALEEYFLRRHCDTKHQEKYSALNQQQLAEEIKQLQKNRSKQLDCFSFIVLVTLLLY